MPVSTKCICILQDYEQLDKGKWLIYNTFITSHNPSRKTSFVHNTKGPLSMLYNLDELTGALAAQHDEENAFVDWVSTQIAEGGTHRPGFFS